MNASPGREVSGSVNATPERRLSPSEAKVAELVIAGLSNKEIADRLFVSVNTVETHLRHAFKKLDVRTRVQLAMKLTRGGPEGSE